MKEYLTIADRHGIRTVFVLNDGVWGGNPTLGPIATPFQNHLRLLYQEDIGAINWGLVSGKSQTITLGAIRRARRARPRWSLIRGFTMCSGRAARRTARRKLT